MSADESIYNLEYELIRIRIESNHNGSKRFETEILNHSPIL